jgi:hypothetical protein
MNVMIDGKQYVPVKLPVPEEANERALRDEVKRMRTRIERLRGMLKTNAGWWYELSDDDKGDACMEAAEDMEARLTKMPNDLAKPPGAALCDRSA